MTPIELKSVKKGDIFYERVPLHWHKFEALEDCKHKEDIEIMNKLFKQYSVLVRNEHAEERHLLVTEGLSYYCGKYFKPNGND